MFQALSLVKASSLSIHLDSFYIAKEHSSPIEHSHSETESEHRGFVKIEFHEHEEPHQQTHRHSPDEPIHSHAHHHAGSHLHGLTLFAGSSYLYSLNLDVSLNYRNFNEKSTQSPFLDSVFRPPIC